MNIREIKEMKKVSKLRGMLVNVLDYDIILNERKRNKYHANAWESMNNLTKYANQQFINKKIEKNQKH